MNLKEKALCLFALFLPLEQLLSYVFGIETEFKPYRVFLILAFAATLLNKNFKKYKANSVIKLLLFIFIYGLVIGLLRIGMGKGELPYLTNGASHFLLGLMIVYLISNISSYKLLNKIGKYLIIGILISSIYGFYHYFSGDYRFIRLRGFFNNPNHLAFAINFITPLLFFKLRNENRKIIYFTLIIFFTLIVILTGSRTGLLIQVCSILLLFTLFNNNISNFMRAIFTGFIAFYFVLLPIININNNIFSRFDKSSYETASGRIDITDAALKLGADTYFTGVGIGQYKYYHLDYISSTAYHTVLDYKLSTHSHFLDLLVNFGFISFLFFIIILIIFFRAIYRKRAKDTYKYALIILFILITSSLSQEMFIFPLFWIILGSLNIIIINSYNEKKSFRK
jgi:oligosaccharide repeat unit polymerase